MKRDRNNLRIKVDTEHDGTSSLGTLGQLLQAAMPEVSADAASAEALSPESAPAIGTIRFRPVITIERKGRGGKTVTICRAGELTEAMRAHVCRKLARSLGCGCRAEGENIVIQGDHRDRVRRWCDTTTFCATAPEEF
jgi:translation initiation factor 1 (eIF-1/SUI1)